MDNLTPEQRRKNMQRIRSTGTKPERMIMEELEKLGFEFIRNDKTVTGKPDLVFSKKKIAVFVDSDFWHCNPERFVKPKTNVEYWEKKIKRNVERDMEVNQKLKNNGWIVVRIWEYDIKHDFNGCINEILNILGNNAS